MPGTVRGTRELAVGKTEKVPASGCSGSGGGDRQSSIGSRHLCYRGWRYGERLAGQGHVCEKGREGCPSHRGQGTRVLTGGDTEQSPELGVGEREQLRGQLGSRGPGRGTERTQGVPKGQE